MKLEDIKRRAHFSEVHKYVELVKEARKEYPKGTDVQIPLDVIDKVEKICDNIEIPVYAVTHYILSVADSYQDLYEYVLRR